MWKTKQAWLDGKSCFSHTNASTFRRQLQSLLLRYTAENSHVTYFQYVRSACANKIFQKWTVFVFFFLKLITWSSHAKSLCFQEVTAQFGKCSTLIFTLQAGYHRYFFTIATYAILNSGCCVFVYLFTHCLSLKYALKFQLNQISLFTQLPPSCSYSKRT